MKVYNNLADLPKFNQAVVTIGSFDGVHTGHQKIIEQVNRLAKSISGESILITFHPHPRHFLYPDGHSLKLLNTIDEKAQLVEYYGIDHLVVVPFNKKFSQQSPEAYIEDFLMALFNPAYVVIGYDHKFGMDRKGNIALLQQYAKEGHFKIVEIEKQEVEDIAVSSTKIRQAIQKGDVKAAAQLLGHPYTLSGTVVHGQKIGHSIGFPTANVEQNYPHKLIPPFGVYAVRVAHRNQSYHGMLYIGNRPTLTKDNKPTIEVNIFDFDKNIYGDRLQLEFVDYIRPALKFDGLEALSLQLGKDKISAKQLLAASQLKTTSVKKKRPEVKPKVAIVILNYNGHDFLQQFIPSIQKSTYDHFEIHVADNGSTDDSLAMLARNFPEIEVHDLKQNHGFAQGYNEALEMVKAEYLVLLNSDVEVEPNWIQPVIELMESDETIAAVQPKIRAFHQKSHFEYAGAAGGWMDHLGIPFCRGRIFGHLEKDEGQYNQSEEIFWASGAAFFVRSKLFKAIGGFDGDYFAHMEEIDLCWRLKRAGYKIMVQPKSIVYHVGGGTLTYGSPNKTFLNFRNSYYTLVKNLESHRLWWVVLIRLIIDAVAALQFLLRGKFAHIPAIIRAHWTFFSHIGKVRKKRRYYQELVEKTSIQSRPNQTGIYHKSIVLQYYLRGKKTFKTLKW
ncbi:MAG: bifunctional riboflavin kinase/FAD synthetase [Bacteroidota bacterium]